MLGNSNYVDITGQIEEVFDEKIQQINFLTEDNVKDKIEEAVAEIEIRPELFDDVYSKIDHTHTSFDNLTVNGIDSNNGIVNFTFGGDYLGINTYTNDRGGVFIDQYTKDGSTRRLRTTLVNGYGHSDFPGNLTVSQNITVKQDAYILGNANINGDLYVKGVKIDGSGGGTVEIPDVIDKNLTMGKNLNVSGSLNLYDYGIYWPQVSIVAGSGPNLYIHTENYCNIYGDLQITGATKSTGDLITSSGLTVRKNANVSGDLNVTGDLTVKGDVDISSAEYVFGPGFQMNSEEISLFRELNCENNGAYFGGDVNIDGDLTVNGVKINSNQTITHKTDEINGEIGTFCETNGGIYTGYDKIAETDCICQVQQSNTLNPKIVGIITDKDQFASHGDVLVKIVPGTYHLGDILCPDISGKARKATETELQYMMLHAIPRAKITSLDTKIEGTVACFIV